MLNKKRIIRLTRAIIAFCRKYYPNVKFSELENNILGLPCVGALKNRDLFSWNTSLTPEYIKDLQRKEEQKAIKRKNWEEVNKFYGSRTKSRRWRRNADFTVKNNIAQSIIAALKPAATRATEPYKFPYGVTPKYRFNFKSYDHDTNEKHQNKYNVGEALIDAGNGRGILAIMVDNPQRRRALMPTAYSNEEIDNTLNADLNDYSEISATLKLPILTQDNSNKIVPQIIPLVTFNEASSNSLDQLKEKLKSSIFPPHTMPHVANDDQTEKIPFYKPSPLSQGIKENDYYIHRMETILPLINNHRKYGGHNFTPSDVHFITQMGQTMLGIFGKDYGYGRRLFNPKTKKLVKNSHLYTAIKKERPDCTDDWIEATVALSAALQKGPQILYPDYKSNKEKYANIPLGPRTHRW